MGNPVRRKEMATVAGGRATFEGDSYEGREEGMFGGDSSMELCLPLKRAEELASRPVWCSSPREGGGRGSAAGLASQGVLWAAGRFCP